MGSSYHKTVGLINRPGNWLTASLLFLKNQTLFLLLVVAVTIETARKKKQEVVVVSTIEENVWYGRWYCANLGIRTNDRLNFNYQ